LAAFSACGSGAPSKTFEGARIDRFKVGSDGAEVLVPATPNGHLVVFYHGAGESESGAITEEVKVVTCRGNHGDPSHLQPKRCVA
jgi:hypothetical protein